MEKIRIPLVRVCFTGLALLFSAHNMRAFRRPHVLSKTALSSMVRDVDNSNRCICVNPLSCCCCGAVVCLQLMVSSEGVLLFRGGWYVGSNVSKGTVSLCFYPELRH